MDDAAYLRVNAAEVVHEVIDGEVVIINVRSGHYYHLRDSAAVIWAALAGGTTLGALRAAMEGRWAADAAAVGPSVDRFVGFLSDEKIVVASREPQAVGASLAAPATVADPTVFAEPVIERFTDMADLLTLDPVHDVDETGWPFVKDRA